MKKIYFISTSIVLLFLAIITIVPNLEKENEILKNSIHKKESSNGISMLFETTGGSGVYQEVTNTTWPTGGYKFNTTLSKCENGGELSWDDTNKQVKMAGTSSDKCYVYFDAPIPLATYIKTKVYTGTQGENNIYYHDGSLENGINDNSYRYAGSYETVENYVCFGYDETSSCPWDNMYRIVGVFDDQVKLIKADYAKKSDLGTGGDYYGMYNYSGTNKGSNQKELIGGYYWNYNSYVGTNANIWSNSRLNKINLNDTYINRFSQNWQSKIATTMWNVGGHEYEIIENQNATSAYQNEIVNPKPGTYGNGITTYQAKIGLMYVSDYGFAAEPSSWSTNLKNYSNVTSTNWMYNGLNEWTITRDSYNNATAFAIVTGGNVIMNMVIDCWYAVRPCFYLEPTVTYVSGSGSYSEPYRIS